MVTSYKTSWISVLLICFRILSASSQDLGCIEEADVIFLLDGSDSISEGEFAEQKTLVEQFIAHSNIGQETIRVGVVVVSSDIGDTISLAQSSNKNKLLRTLSLMEQPQDGSRIDLGINKLERMLYSEGRKDVSQIGIIVTDGRSKYPDASRGESEALKSIGIHLFCVGVGRLVDEKQLRAMAFSPDEYFYIKPFSETLDRILTITKTIAVSKCQERRKLLTTLPPPTTKLLPTTTTTKPTTTTTPITTPETTTTTTTPAPTRPEIIVYQPIYDAEVQTTTNNDENKQLKISVKSNILNGKDIVGTKVEKIFSRSDEPWWNTNPNDLQAQPENTEPTYQVQNWYNPTDPIHAPWVTTAPVRSTPIAWRTYAPTPQSYQIQQSDSNNREQSDANEWSGGYRNPLVPVKLFSIEMPIKVYQEPERPFVPREESKTQELVDQTTTTTLVTTAAKVTTRKPDDHRPGPVALTSDKIEEEHLCYGSQYVDGVGYNADPKSCNEFIQCFYEGGQIKVERARCPFRMFWDQRLLLCRPATSMSCWRDPCFDFTVRSYNHRGNCRAHYSCRNGLSQAKCCRMGSSYNEEKQECVPDPGCTDWCEDTGELTFTSPFASCRMTPFETNERFYFEEIPGMGMMTRSCPRGSQYNPGLCTCDRSDEVRKENCRPELILDFQDGFNDKSGNNLAVTPENVHVESGAARFDGSGKIRLWRFSGVSYGSKFAVTMRYKENPESQISEPMHLLSNCFNPEVMRPSIDIAISPNKGAMFLATTDKGGEQMAILKYNSTDWKTLSFVYDGKQLTGSIDGVQTRVPLRGVIEERPSALILGACDYFGGYGGLMDDVKLYLCVPHGLT